MADPRKTRAVALLAEIEMNMIQTHLTVGVRVYTTDTLKAGKK